MNYLLLLFAFIIFFTFSVFFGGTQENGSYNFVKSSRVIQQNTSLQSFQFMEDEGKKNNEHQSTGDVNSSWAGKVIKNIRNEEYNISYNEETKTYQSPNRVNNIRFTYHKDGFIAKTRENKIPLFDLNDKRIKEDDKKYKSIPEWELRLKINGYYHAPGFVDGVNKNLISFSTNEIKVDENKASIEDDNMRINYTNDERGMRQDFIIKKRPDGDGNLTMEFSAETKLNVIINEGELIFKDRSDHEMMKYSSLKVWDANGKGLKANFEKINQPEFADSKLFAIVVNDEDASYPITIDPISTSPNWVAEGNQTDGGFGFSVSTAGDVNNDGYSDVIIGAPYYDNGHTNEGRAFVYYGSNLGLSPIAFWTAEGNQDYCQFGWSVSTAGDVNNDGYDDVIVGADAYTNNQAYEGVAFVYYGSITGLSLIANKTLESTEANAKFGHSVSTAGDVNNDNFSDIIVGAPLYDNVQVDEGRTFIYYGSPSGPSVTANMTGESNQANSFFGISVSSAGDVNGDGYDDIVIGSNTYDNPQRDQGSSFIYYGSATGISPTSNWKSASIAEWFTFVGGSVSAAGDINGDGYDDVISGAIGCDNVEIDEGRVFVFYGSATGLTLTANWTAENNQAYSRFGNSVSTAGDVNNDGYSDVIVGSYFYDNGQSNEGKVFLYYGSPVGLTSAVWTAESNQADASFGWSVSTAGDVNNDGYSDIIIGSHTYDNGQSNEGRVFVYHGASGGPKVLSLKTFIQGLYSDITNNTLTDSVKVYLRNSNPPYTLVDSSKSKINTSGVATYSFFNNVSNGVNYYLQVVHRNSITTWSKTPQSFTNNFKSYNFTTASTQAFGNNEIGVDASPVAYAIYSGDVNQDEAIELEDILLVYNNASIFLTGYTLTDLNGDNVTDLTDLLITTNNAANFVEELRP